MGIEKLKQFLSAIVSEERWLEFMLAYDQLFIQFGDEFDYTVDTMITQTMEMEVDVALSTLTNQTLLFLSEALVKYGVLLDDEALDYTSVKPTALLLKAMIEFEDYEDPQSLMDALEAEGWSDDAIIDALAIVVGETRLTFEGLVRKFTDNVKPNLQSLLQDAIEEFNREEPSTVIINPLLPAIAKEALLVNEGIVRSLVTNPHQLTLHNLLRVFGNRAADSNHPALWYFLGLISTEQDVKLLTTLWDKHFLDENQKIQAFSQLQQYAKQHGVTI